MIDKSEFVQANGFTFYAVSSDYGASWAKALDPITAIRNAATSGNAAVRCVYGKEDELSSDGLGNIFWDDVDNPPIPVGLFLVTPRKIIPMPEKSKEFPKNSYTNEQWISDFFKDVKAHKE